jgi:hypothetical protein
MDVNTLPGDRRGQARNNVPRSGGRTAAREQTWQDDDYTTHGATALQPTAAPQAKPRRGDDDADAPARLRVAPPAPVAAPRAPFVALVLVLVLVGVVGILVLNTKIAENAFVLDHLHKKQTTLDQNEQQLTSDIANNESPVNLAARASQLGLVPSRTPAALLLPDGTKLTMPGPGNGKQ